MENKKKKFKKAVEKVWRTKIRKDYNKRFLFREDSLKSRLFHHLSTELGDDFFLKGKVRMFTEYTLPDVKMNIQNARADIVLVDISNTDGFQGEVLAVIEIKYKISNVGTGNSIREDYEKMSKYHGESSLKNADLYMATVNSGVDDEDSGESWIDHPTSNNGYLWDNKPFTELILDYKSDDLWEWHIYDWNYKDDEDMVYNYVSLNKNICTTCLRKINKNKKIDWEDILKKLIKENDVVKKKNKCCRCGKIEEVYHQKLE